MQCSRLETLPGTPWCGLTQSPVDFITGQAVTKPVKTFPEGRGQGAACDPEELSGRHVEQDGLSCGRISGGYLIERFHVEAGNDFATERFEIRDH